MINLIMILAVQWFIFRQSSTHIESNDRVFPVSGVDVNSQTLNLSNYHSGIFTEEFTYSNVRVLDRNIDGFHAVLSDGAKSSKLFFVGDSVLKFDISPYYFENFITARRTSDYWEFWVIKHGELCFADYDDEQISADPTIIMNVDVSNHNYIILTDDDNLYILDSSGLTNIDCRSKMILWSIKTPEIDNISNSFLYSWDGNVCIAYNGGVLCFNPISGKKTKSIEWSMPIDETVRRFEIEDSLDLSELHGKSSYLNIQNIVNTRTSTYIMLPMCIINDGSPECTYFRILASYCYESDRWLYVTGTPDFQIYSSAVLGDDAHAVLVYSDQRIKLQRREHTIYSVGDRFAAIIVNDLSKSQIERRIDVYDNLHGTFATFDVGDAIPVFLHCTNDGTIVFDLENNIYWIDDVSGTPSLR